MRILLLEPGDFSTEEIRRQEEYAKTVCSPGTTPVISLVKASSPPPKDFSMFGYYLPDLLERARAADNEGYDAIIICCFTDIGLEQVKIAANIPVIGPAESSLHLACLLADIFGLIVPMEEGIPFHWRQVKNYGLADRIASIKGANIPLSDFHDKKEDSEARLVKLAREMLEEGAHLIIVGCMGIMPALGIGSVAKLSKELGAVIIDPVEITLRTAEMLVSLNLRQSDLTFPKKIKAI